MSAFRRMILLIFFLLALGVSILFLFLPDYLQPLPPAAAYYLRDLHGRVAVYPADSPAAEPLQVYDIYTRLLPEEDVLALQQGVPAAEEPANCIFEQVYFARPDSIMNGKSVYACRYDMGRQLAHEEPVEADLVIGVPDSGLPPAEGYSHESGIPFGEGLIKNRYVGRTFIEPTQELRAMGVRMKLNPLRDNIEGKRLVVIDDSIVRGTTMVQLVKMLRNAGAKEIHIRINSPEVIWPCFYGIDTDVQSQLISANKTVDEICEYIGADSLAFLSVEGLLKVMPKGGYCDACFTGRYPVAIPESFGRDKFMEGFKPRNLDKPLHFDDDAVVEKYDDRSWEEEHGEA